jgi:nucleoside-diphosphate-sugar epimerase
MTPLMQLAELLKEAMGFSGKIVTDPTMPEGSPRAPLDCSLLRSFGWQPRVELEDGVRATWEFFRAAYLAGTLRGG